MPRKHDDAHKDELEGVAQRLRDERPEASPLDLDRIKTVAMSRAQAGTRRGRAGARRLAVASLTVGLLAAGTGGVLAHNSDKGSGNAAVAEYGSNCDVNNSSNGNTNTTGSVTGNANSNGNNTDNCNENSFNTENITENNTTTNTITNNYYATNVTVTASPTTATGAVQGTSTTKPASIKHPVKFRIDISKKSKLKKVTLKINGKVVSVLKGKKASANISIANLPCSANGTTVTVTAVTANGKTITQSHTYHICS
jgi:hypothetical protein